MTSGVVLLVEPWVERCTGVRTMSTLQCVVTVAIQWRWCCIGACCRLVTAIGMSQSFWAFGSQFLPTESTQSSMLRQVLPLIWYRTKERETLVV